MCEIYWDTPAGGKGPRLAFLHPTLARALMADSLTPTQRRSLELFRSVVPDTSSRGAAAADDEGHGDEDEARAVRVLQRHAWDVEVGSIRRMSAQGLELSGGCPCFP